MGFKFRQGLHSKQNAGHDDPALQIELAVWELGI
jgi:hypothetical protein